DCLGERLEYRDVARLSHDQVVGRRAQRGADRLPAVTGEPEPVRGVERRMVTQGSGNAEDQVVARLVGKQERRGGVEEGGGILDAANVHAWIVGTPPQTTTRPLVILDRTIARMLPAVPKPLVHMLAQRYIAGPTLEDACRVVRAAN